MKKYKHKSGIIVSECGKRYLQESTNSIEYIPAWLVENSSDWTEIKEDIIQVGNVLKYIKNPNGYYIMKITKAKSKNSVSGEVLFSTLPFPLTGHKSDLFNTSDLSDWELCDPIFWLGNKVKIKPGMGHNNDIIVEVLGDSKIWPVTQFSAKVINNGGYEKLIIDHIFDTVKAAYTQYIEPIIYLTTQDGVDITNKSQNLFYTTEGQFRVSNTKSWYSWTNRVPYLFFTTQEACEKWIKENKPCISIKELQDIVKADGYIIDKMCAVRSLIKKKSN